MHYEYKYMRTTGVHDMNRHGRSGWRFVAYKHPASAYGTDGLYEKKVTFQRALWRMMASTFRQKVLP
jgi:hypothetical protein